MTLVLAQHPVFMLRCCVVLWWWSGVSPRSLFMLWLGLSWAMAERCQNQEIFTRPTR